VAKDVATPAVGVRASKISPGDLLKDVSHVQGFQDRQVSRLLTVVLTDLLDEAGPRKGPFIWTDRQEKGWVTILADSVYQEQVLPAPVRCRERFVLEACVWTASRHT